MGLNEQEYLQEHKQAVQWELWRIRRYAWFIAIFWTTVIVVIFVKSVQQEQQHTEETARIIARAAFEKDVLYRRWNAEIGGVYGAVTETMQPNPYLEDLVDERDITTLSGRQLTLINPAYMTRQVFELGIRNGSPAEHITSLKPIRPANAASPWETEALRQFEQDVAEVSALATINDEEVMRYMRPLYVETACLKCHKQQGYKVGDVRGGISVVVPMADLRTIERIEIDSVAAGLAILWVLGVIGLVLVTQRLGRGITRRHEIEQLYWEQASQVRQMQKMESIGVLAGGVAHDFNNILTAINGHAELALRKIEETQPIRHNLESILKAGTRAQDLTSQLLAFSRKQIHKSGIIDLNTVIVEMEPMLRRLISEDIHIEMCFDADILPIQADPVQIEQILVNLVVNARDAIEERAAVAAEKKITIETGQVYLDEDYVARHVDSKTGRHVFFAVSDTGVGMTADVKNRIFEPFFTTKAQGHGTGLGLATVYGIVKQNDADVYIYSEPDIGTTFKIYWPVAPADNAAPMPEMRPTAANDYSGTETILLVEDDAGVREFACAALEGLGYRVSCAGDGLEALDMLAQAGLAVNLLITDVIMPNMNGDELAKKAAAAIPNLRILYASGYTDNHIVHKGRLAKGTNFLQKPYSVDELAKRVREVLDTPV